jgi:cytochrome c peroxidase
MRVLRATALGAFVGSLVSAPTPFDRFRDALERGDPGAAARYPPEALRGLRLFVGRGRCHLCHGGPRLSHGEFADIGAGFFVRPGVVDPGRHGGILALQRSRHNLLSAYADAPGEAALKTRHVQLQHRNFGEFKVPSLRNVALTAPYLHDGRILTLDGVLRHYSELDLDRLHADGERILEPLHLSEAESRDLKAFLQSLTDPAALDWAAPAAPRCR